MWKAPARSMCGAKCSAATTAERRLLDIVPEGTRVKAGRQDLRARFLGLGERAQCAADVVDGSEAALIGARAALETAKIAKQEYLEGTFKNEEKLIETERFHGRGRSEAGRSST